MPFSALILKSKLDSLKAWFLIFLTLKLLTSPLLPSPTERSRIPSAEASIEPNASLGAVPLPRAYNVSPPSPLILDALSSKKLTTRSEEHTSELQSRENLVCRLLLEKKK